MDLRDEVAGTHGTIWLNHFLRTGFEMFTAGGGGGYVAEKAETSAGWLFPVGDEVSELGYVDMFSDMFRAIERARAPQETFYDGYVVNAIMDAATARRRRTPGSRSSSSGAADDAADRVDPRDVRRTGRHQARDPARRPPQAHPQGPGHRATSPTGWSRGADAASSRGLCRGPGACQSDRNVVGVLVVGPHATGEFVTERSDIDCYVITRDARPDLVDTARVTRRGVADDAGDFSHPCSSGDPATPGIARHSCGHGSTSTGSTVRSPGSSNGSAP